MRSPDKAARAKRLRAAALLTAVLLGYWGWRQWRFAAWTGRLEKALPERLEQRRDDLAALLVRCEQALVETDAPRAVPEEPPTLAAFLETDPSPLAFKVLRDRIVEELSTPTVFYGIDSEPFEKNLLNAPTHYLTEYHKRFFVVGAWEFLRHLYDRQGSTLLYFPAAGYREAALTEERPLRQWLSRHDRVIAFDVPPAPKEQREGLCPQLPPQRLAARRVRALLAQLEAEAGGPPRYLAVRSEGQAAALFLALALPRIGEVALAPPAPPYAEDQGRLALLLALLWDRNVLVEEGALVREELARLERANALMEAP